MNLMRPLFGLTVQCQKQYTISSCRRLVGCELLSRVPVIKSCYLSKLHLLQPIKTTNVFSCFYSVKSVVREDMGSKASQSYYFRFKVMMKKYGKIAATFYLGLDFIVVSGLYFAMSHGINLSFLEMIGVKCDPENTDERPMGGFVSTTVNCLNSIGIQISPKTISLLIVAFAANKVLFPIRAAFCMGALPYLVKFLRYLKLTKVA